MALGWPVLTPTRTPCDSTSSSVWASLRFGLADRLSQTREPGASSPSIVPELAQWAVVAVPSSNSTSARNRLYRRSSRAGVSGAAKRIPGKVTGKVTGKRGAVASSPPMAGSGRDQPAGAEQVAHGFGLGDARRLGV